MTDADRLQADRERFDRLDVADLILRERLARDNKQWDRMAACYHRDSMVDLSWFHGSGADFVTQTQRATQAQMNFHMLTPPVVDVDGGRAVSEMPCGLRSFSTLDGVEVTYEGFVHLFWRALRDDERWLLFGLRVAYKVDMFHAREPAKPPHFDQTQLKTFRDSYRYMMINLASAGLAVRDDLNGFDRPETVAALRQGEAAWLAGD